MCGFANGPTDRFCGECGTALAEAAPRESAAPGAQSGGALADAIAEDAGTARAEAARSAPVAERRIVSILFADLVGFTSLAQDLDPESVRELLTRYFDLAREVVARYGGTIEKFIGDAVMAVWGAPTAHEDDAERAVRAALDLVEAVRALEVPRGATLELRAGVLTGQAAVTLGAEGQGMVAGDLVNTASRLQSVAPPGTVLVGESTYQAAGGAIAFEAAGDQLLRGKTAPVTAWRALRVVGMKRGVGRTDMLEAPFVGRDAELRLIKEMLHATGRERRLRLISVIGLAGIGKSRLAWEFHKYIDGITEPINWHQGRSPAYGEGITFWALGEMVRKRAGLAEADDAATTRARLADALVKYVHDESERRWMEPRLLQLLGLLEEGRGGERDELFAAWRTFFERVSEEATTVLLFEDLQWADAGLLDFIDHLLEWSRNHPILVITVARPDLLERRPEWGAGRRSFMSLSLEPLVDEDMRALLRGLVPGLPEPTVAAILARADGVPLYAVETVRMLLHNGQLEAREGVYRPVGRDIRLDVPESLHALIAARLDAIDAPSRSLLQDAAILGQTFAVPALVSVSGIETAELEPRLRTLVQRELLALEVDPRSPERGQYSFVQALIREVAEATLSKRDRRARHLAAARYFEGLGDEELAGLLASHYRDAYLAVPEGPEGEAVAVQARIALRGAAERAMALHSNEQALAFLDQAITISPDAAEDADLLERAGNAAIMASRHEVAASYLKRAIDRYRAIGDDGGAARATGRLGSSLLLKGQVEQAIGLLGSVVEGLPSLEADPALVSVAAQLARAYMVHEEPQKALDWAERTLVAAERLDLVAEIAEAMNTRALTLQVVGRIREATMTMRGALWLAHENDLTSAELRAYNNLTFLLATADPRAALEIGAEGIERAEKMGSRDWALNVSANLAVAAFRTGDWATAGRIAAEWSDRGSTLESTSVTEIAATEAVIMAARDEAPSGRLAAAVAQAPDASDPQITAVVGQTDAWLALLDGRFDDAQKAAMQAARHATGYAASSMAIAVRAGVWAGDARGAASAAEAFEGFGVHGPAIEVTRRAIRAGVAMLNGRRDEAVRGYDEALRAWRDLGARFELALTAVDAAVAFGRIEPWLEPSATEARAILQALGAVAILRRLDRPRVTEGRPQRAGVEAQSPERAG